VSSVLSIEMSLGETSTKNRLGSGRVWYTLEIGLPSSWNSHPNGRSKHKNKSPCKYLQGVCDKSCARNAGEKQQWAGHPQQGLRWERGL
jgi:hypothetical protein